MLNQDPEQIIGWVRRLCPAGTSGRVWIGSKGSGFKGARFDPIDIHEITRYCARYDRDPGIFIRMTTLRLDAPPEGRGSAEHSRQLLGLWADIDIRGPGHKHDPAKYHGRDLPPDEDAARLLVKHLPEPTAWVHSGGGLYPFWLPTRDATWQVNEDSRGQLAALLSDLQWSIAQVAAEHGWHYGTGVGDLARILRIPGTVNRKTTPAMCQIEWGGGPTYDLQSLRDAIPKPPAPEPRRAPVAIPKVKSRFSAPASVFIDEPGAIGPLDDYAARNDLCTLIEQDGWSFCYEHDGRRHYARPGKRTTDGPSGNVYLDDGRQVLFVFSDSAGLPTMVGLSAGQWYAHRYHQGDLRDAARALRAAGYGAVSSGASAWPPRASQTPAGTSIPTAVPERVLNVAQDIWGRRPILAAIKRTAQERLVGPWAVLGAVLAHAACHIGPHVVLPPIVGSYASLNLLVALVGASGGGKGAASAVAADLLGVSTPTRKLGTGQGIDAAFTAQTKEGPVQYNDTALFIAAEIDQLRAHSQMTGSTLLATLREVYSGEELGAHYADKHKRRPVKPHRYRAAVLAGVQPARADVLLSDADGGTPQRWLWLPVSDPEHDQIKPRFSPPLRMHWWTDFQAWCPSGEGDESTGVQIKPRVEIEVCETAVVAIRTQRKARLVADLLAPDPDMAGHALLTRLKVAALLGLLEQRAQVTDDDWELAGLLMTTSEHTRTTCQTALSDKARLADELRGRSGARREAALREETANIDEVKVARLAKQLLAKLIELGEATAGDLRRTARSTHRAYLQDALDLLVEQGMASAEEMPRGTRYRALVK